MKAAYARRTNLQKTPHLHRLAFGGGRGARQSGNRGGGAEAAGRAHRDATVGPGDLPTAATLGFGGDAGAGGAAARRGAKGRGGETMMMNKALKGFANL